MSTAANPKKDSTPDAPAAGGGSSKIESAPPEKKGPLPNRPGEPDFKMELSPDCVTFVCSPDKKPVWCDLKLKNTSTDMQCFKVKCTSADIFRVQPPLGFVKKDETVNVRVWFQNKVTPEPNHKHYFAVYHVKSCEGKVAKDVWKEKATKPDGVRRLGALFTDKPTA